jgi:tetratricopeptide (TPR) repeat protein
MSSIPVSSGQDIAQLAYRARVNLYDTWNFDSVVYYFKKVIGREYAPAFGYSDYGWYLMLEGKVMEGYSNIQKAADMAPKDKQLLAWNSWAILWQGDANKAKKWIVKAMALDKNYGEALYINSLIESRLGNHTEAIRLAEKAALNDPNWRGGIPLALAKAGKDNEAITWAEKISKKINAYDAMLLMEVYLTLNDIENAIKYLNASFNLRHPFLPWLEFTPGVEKLQGDVRYKAILKKLNLPK